MLYKVQQIVCVSSNIFREHGKTSTSLELLEASEQNIGYRQRNFKLIQLIIRFVFLQCSVELVTTFFSFIFHQGRFASDLLTGSFDLCCGLSAPLSQSHLQFAIPPPEVTLFHALPQNLFSASCFPIQIHFHYATIITFSLSFFIFKMAL